MKFSAAAFCSELFSLAQNGSEQHSESLLLFFFHGTEFQVVFSSTEWFGTEIREFASIFVPRVPAQTQTGIGLLGKPPTVKQFPPSEATRPTRLLRGPRANPGMKLTSVVEHNLYFAGLAIVG